MNTPKQYTIHFEEGVFVFNYQDEFGSVVTDGKTIESLRSNIKEAMQLHQEHISNTHSKPYTPFEFTMPLTLSFSDTSYATHLQTNS